MTLDAHAALRLDDRGLRGRCSIVVLPALVGRADAAAARPPGRARTSSSRAQGGSAAALPARVLVLRPPRGLHHDPARRWGSSRRSSPSSRASRSSATRRSRSRRSAIAFFSMLVWAHHMFTVGLPSCLERLLHDHARCSIARADRRQDLQLARDDSGAGTSSSTRRCCSRSASSRCSRSAASSGIFLAAFPVDWQVTRHVLRRRAPALRALRRLDLRRSSPGSTTGGRRCSGACSTSGSASCTSG